MYFFPHFFARNKALISETDYEDDEGDDDPGLGAPASPVQPHPQQQTLNSNSASPQKKPKQQQQQQPLDSQEAVVNNSASIHSIPVLTFM